MMNRDVVFGGGNDRIGFADANCTYRAFKSPFKSDDASSSSSRASADPSAVSSFINGSHSGNGAAGAGGNANSLFASTPPSKSHLAAFLIGVGFIAFVLVVMAIVLLVLRRRGRATQTRRHHYGGRDLHQVRVFDDDDDEDFEPGGPSIYDDSRDPKESFVTPHFLIHSPPALISRSPRNQLLEHEDEWGCDDGGGDGGRRTIMLDRWARETQRGSDRPNRVEL